MFSPVDQTQRSSIVCAHFADVESRQIVESLGVSNIIKSPRRDCFRFSPHLYNSEDDINHTVRELKNHFRKGLGASSQPETHKHTWA